MRYTSGIRAVLVGVLMFAMVSLGFGQPSPQLRAQTRKWA